MYLRTDQWPWSAPSTCTRTTGAQFSACGRMHGRIDRGGHRYSPGSVTPHTFSPLRIPRGIEWSQRATTATHAPRRGYTASALKVEWRSRPHHPRNCRARHARPRARCIVGVRCGQSARIRRTPRRILVTWLAASDFSSRSQSLSSVVPAGLIGSFLVILHCHCLALGRVSPFVLYQPFYPSLLRSKGMREHDPCSDPRRTYRTSTNSWTCFPLPDALYTLYPFPTLCRASKFSGWNTLLASLGAGTIPHWLRWLSSRRAFDTPVLSRSLRYS